MIRRIPKKEPEKDPMHRQEENLFLEQTTSMIAVMLLALGLLDLIGMFHDGNSYILFLLMGLLLNIVAAVWDHRKKRTVLMWLEILLAAGCLGGFIYLTWF